MESVTNPAHVRPSDAQTLPGCDVPLEGTESLMRMDRALTAAVRNLADVREALASFCAESDGSSRGVPSILPELLTVPEVCRLLGYRKTKVYELMKSGLLPFVVHTKTGHRRIEYRAVQQFVKRLRGAFGKRKAS